MTLALDLHFPNSGNTAKFSADGRYRYRLTRCLDRRLPEMAVVGLNPSKAGAFHTDQTVFSISRLAKSSGHGRFTLVNLNAAVETDPDTLAYWHDPAGPENDHYLREVAEQFDLIVLAWGTHADPVRARQVASMMWRGVCAHGGQLGVWGWTANGQPHHPLYLASDTPLSCLSGTAHPTYAGVDQRWTSLIADTSDDLDEVATVVGGQYV